MDFAYDNDFANEVMVDGVEFSSGFDLVITGNPTIDGMQACATAMDQEEGTALIEIEVLDTFGIGISLNVNDAVESSLVPHLGGSWWVGPTDLGGGLYQVRVGSNSDVDVYVNIVVEGVTIESGMNFVITGN